MDLTAERKQQIDSLTYEQLLAKWRSAPLGDSWFQGATGEYWGKRMAELRDADPDGAVVASKRLGWSR